MDMKKALDPKQILPAEEADIALNMLRIAYCDLLLKHDILCGKYEILQKATVRVLDVLAAQTEREKLHG